MLAIKINYYPREKKPSRSKNLCFAAYMYVSLWKYRFKFCPIIIFLESREKYCAIVGTFSPYLSAIWTLEQEIAHVYLLLIILLLLRLTFVAFAEKLHSHDGKYEDNDAEDDGQVPKGSHSLTHDWD